MRTCSRRRGSMQTTAISTVRSILPGMIFAGCWIAPCRRDLFVIARSAATKQPQTPVAGLFELDCFSSLAMTEWIINDCSSESALKRSINRRSDHDCC